MAVVPVINIILLVTLNSAIPLFNGTSSVVVSNASSSHELSPLAWPPTDGDCRRKATCVSHNATCFGVPVPYGETSTEVVANLFKNRELSNFKILEQDLQRWESLRKIPKCWSILQPFLCALYMPKCEQDAVYLLTQKRCRFTMSTCKVLREQPFASIFPPINCDDVEYFSGTCKHDVKDPKSNITGECVPPLIQTGDAKSEYDVVTGCGVQCQDPMYTEEEHDVIHGRIALVGTLSLLSNLFVVVTFAIDWPSGNKYPALTIFYINVCFLISNLGWLVQFLPNAREDIVCKKDMTLRRFQPSQGENLSCVIVFIIIYYFIMAAIVWFAILAYSWNLWIRALGKIQERVDKKGPYFHLVAWSLPAVLTLTTIASGQIEGNSIAGICFVRSSHWGARVALLLVPIATSIVISGYYISRGLLFLFNIKRDSQQILSEKDSAKIREIIIRIGIFYFLCLLFVATTFLFHMYEFTLEESWQNSFRNYIFCLILQSKSEPRECDMDSKPNSAMTQLHVLIMFAAGINMSSWLWTRSAACTWKRFFNRKIFKKEMEEPIILKKHKIIAQAFAKRKELTNAGKLDLSIRNSYTDPVGLKFELNSIASHVSSNWIAVVPKLVDRRGALIDATTESNSSKRRNSYDSESYTYSVRRVSVESRRHSLDSQISLQISEVTATHKTNTPRSHHRSGRSRGKKRRKDFGRARRYHQSGTRRGSSTSQESQIGIKMLTALALNNSGILPGLLKRRPGNAGLEFGNAITGKFSGGSDDDQSQERNMALSDEEDASDDKLCPVGRGIQAMELGDSDSDMRVDSRPDYSDDETTEIEKIEKILKREEAITARETSNKLHIRDLEYHTKSFKRDRRSRVKTDDYLNKSYRHCKLRSGDGGSRRKKGEDGRGRMKAAAIEERYDRKCRNGYRVDKRRKSSASDLDVEAMMIGKRNSESDVERTKCHILKAMNKGQKSNGGGGGEGGGGGGGGEAEEIARGEEFKMEEDSDEGDYGEESHLMQSLGVQMRSGSSRSKRSFTVDVATQMSTQEMATQTDPHDFGVAVPAESSTSNQGTQMTPPLHIRVISKSQLNNAKSSCQLRDRNCSLSSLTDQ